MSLDLLLLSTNTSPPVCKIVDYGQFMYQQKKKDKQAKKSVQTTKELKMSHKISIHDYEHRLRQARTFLSKKFKVKVTITFRGRDIVFRDQLGTKKMQEFLDDIVEDGIKDTGIVKSGRNLSVIINPK